MHTHGWQRALDVQLDTHKFALTDVGEVLNYGLMLSLFSDTPEDRDNPSEHLDSFCKDMVGHLKETLWRGDTIYVTQEMEHVLLQAAHDLPDEITFDPRTLISQYGFALLEEPIVGEDKNDEYFACYAIAWECNPIAPTSLVLSGDPLKLGVVIYFYTDPWDMADKTNRTYTKRASEAGIPIPSMALSHIYTIIEGQTLMKPKLKGQQIVIEIAKFFLAMQIVSHQNIGEVTRMPANRAQRKRYERDYRVASDRMITLITLRRKSMPSGKEPKDIPWTRRWIVRGHWRRQWYPKTKTHDWKYIYEYIKGPEDKPLITGRRVFNFRR